MALMHSSVCAQIEITRPIDQLGFNKNTIVTNNRGVRYLYAEWSRLMATGNYRLEPVQHDSDSTAFVLSKRDEQAESKILSLLPKPEETTFFKTGDTFTFVNLVDMNGLMIKASDLAGKIVVINFWFIACPPCRYEIPELNRLVKAYQNNTDVVFIAISLDRLQDVAKFLKVSPFAYHVIGDSMALFSYYRVDQCPVSLVVDKQGIIKFNSQGYGEGNVPYWIKKTIAEIK